MRNLTEKISDVFDVPGEAAGQPRITLTGTGRLNIENHRGITGYSPDEIRVNSPCGAVSVKGRDLRIAAMSSGELLITGRINGIDLLA